MHQIVIDVTRLVGRFMKGRLPTGVDRVSLAYIQHFSARAEALVRIGGWTLLLPQSKSRQLFEKLLSPSRDFSREVIRLLMPECLRLRRNVNMKGAFLFNTGHSGLEQAAYPEQLRRQGVRPLFLVHDLIPISHPEYCRAGELGKHITRMDNALASATGLIANSQATLDELKAYAAKTGKPMVPAVAALLAPAVLPAPSATRPIDRPYFVMLATIEPRKNHWLLLQLWRKLIERMGDRAPRLVVIGQRGWECENVVDLLERCESLRGVVTELSACSDADLATYLCHAQALLFPSFAEGYGMPLVEALSLRVPVIASDLPVFREIAGEIPDYLDPMDGLGWMAKIQAYTDPDSVERKAQLHRLGQFACPNWATHFQLVEELLSHLKGESGQERHPATTTHQCLEHMES